MLIKVKALEIILEIILKLNLKPYICTYQNENINSKNKNMKTIKTIKCRSLLRLKCEYLNLCCPFIEKHYGDLAYEMYLFDSLCEDLSIYVFVHGQGSVMANSIDTFTTLKERHGGTEIHLTLKVSMLPDDEYQIEILEF